MRFKILFFIAISLWNYLSLFAQCSNFDFDLGSNFCINEKIDLTHDTTNQVRWTFFENKLDNGSAPQKIVDAIPNSGRIYGIEIIRYQGNFYGFFVGRSNKIFRINFYDKVDSDYSLTELAPINASLLDQPITLRIHEQDGKWTGYITNLGANNILKVDFSSNILKSDPELSAFIETPSYSIFNLRLQKFSGETYLFTSAFSSGIVKAYKLNADGSYTFVNDISVTGASDLRYFTSKVICNDLYLFPSDFSQNKIFSVKMADDLMSTDSEATIASITNPLDLSFATIFSETILLAQTRAGGIYRIDFGQNINATPTVSELTSSKINENDVFGLAFYQESDSINHYLMAIESNKREFFKISFLENWDLTAVSSNSKNTTISYPTSGAFPITLSIFDEDGNYTSVTKNAVVDTSESPEGYFSINDAYCVADTIAFIFDSEDAISSYLWDFGDGNSSSDINPNHVYSAADSFNVNLTIDSPEGCRNQYSKVIAVYDEPIPDFTTLKETYCSFENISFVNLTDNYVDGVVDWYWDFGDGNNSELKDPQHTYSNAGDYTVKLSTTILGCEVSVQKELSIVDGPKVDFEIGPVCLGDSVNFTNKSTGENITSFKWDFGNGGTSTVESPSTVFNQEDSYTITLTVTNENGCENIHERTIEVYNQIIDTIVVAEAIENISFSASARLLDGINFDNLDYLWQINDLISTDTAPSFTLSEIGEHVLSLQITTSEGCSFFYEVIVNVVASQHPTPNFAFTKNEICLDELLTLKNQSVNAANFEWEFCVGNFKNPPDLESYISNGPFNTINHVKIYQESKYSEAYFVFVPSRGTKNLYRAKTDKNLTVIETFQPVADVGIDVGGPIDFDVLKIGEQYYGYLLDFDNDRIFELDFGTSLENEPTIDEVGEFAFIDGGYSLEAIRNASKTKLVVTSYNNDILGIITLESEDSTSIQTLNMGTNGRGVDVFFDNSYYIAAALPLSGIVRIYELDTSIDDKILSTYDIIIEGQPNPNHIKLYKEGGKVQALVQANNGTLSHLDFDVTLDDNPIITVYDNLSLLNSNTRGFDLIQNIDSNWKGIVVETSGDLSLIDFSLDCGASLNSSDDLSPMISYSIPDVYPITLTAYHANGNSTSITKEITVRDEVAPSIDYNGNSNACLSNPNIFTAAVSDTSTITDYTWYIDDLDTLSGQEANYQFSAPDTFNVTLHATAANGCGQRVVKEIPIYEEPVPNFKFPDGILCSNSEIPFTNTSETFDADSVIEWSWNFNDEGAAADESATMTFAEDGGKIVSLTASIPGCAPKMTKAFNVAAGPEVNFTAENLCFGEELQYVNETTGDGIVAYNWDLGNGMLSTETEPSLIYDSPDAYAVQLEVGNDQGCVNSLQKTVTVHAIPETDFEYGLACSSATQFFDKSTALNANMETWQWYIRNENGLYDSAANSKDPIIGFPEEGTYRLKLVAGSNYGCFDSTEMDVAVLPGPDAAIGYDPICMGDSVTFQDLTATRPDNPITSWYWEINRKGYFSQEPKYYFEGPGYYVVSLNVEAENLCSDTVFEVVKVNRLPQPDFSALNPCQNESVVFADNSHSPDDPVTDYAWNFDGLKTAKGPKAAFRFPEAKDYQVRLEVTTKNGCQRAITKQIPIHTYPKAKFSLYPKVGVPPQPVALENNSAGAVAYEWNFGETLDSVSTAFEPQYTYKTVGDYTVELIAINEFGCNDTVTNEAAIRLPVLDVELERIVKVVNGNEIQLVARINNNGSLLVSDMDILIEMGDISLKESFSGTLEAGEGKNYPLNFQIVENMKHNLSYACITLAPKFMTYEDETAANNKICIDLNETFTALEPYPNPASNRLHIPFIAPNTDDLIRISLLDMKGNLLHTEEVKPGNTGMNQHSLNLSIVSDGLYLLKIDFTGRSMIRKIRVSN